MVATKRQRIWQVGRRHREWAGREFRLLEVCCQAHRVNQDDLSARLSHARRKARQVRRVERRQNALRGEAARTKSAVAL